jgi:uncharacterized protein (DUF2236 family)
MLASLRSNLHDIAETRLDAAARDFLSDPRIKTPDFSTPAGVPSLVGADSVSWRIFKNPVTLFIGGVAAVFMEFADPAVRTGVWEHSNFRSDPVLRLKRTGLAAMITVYGTRAAAEKMIANVNRMHARVNGVTPAGEAYNANDPDLLNWVQATAAFGFLEAYSAYAEPLSDDDRNRYYREGRTAAKLYGATGAPTSLSEQDAMFAARLPALEAHDIVFEFRNIMRAAPAFPPPAHLIQRTLVRAAIEIVPADIRAVLGLTGRYGLRPLERTVVERMARRAERYLLRSSPAVQACRRMGLPDNYLYRNT